MRWHLGPKTTFTPHLTDSQLQSSYHRKTISILHKAHHANLILQTGHKHIRCVIVVGLHEPSVKIVSKPWDKNHVQLMQRRFTACTWLQNWKRKHCASASASLHYAEVNYEDVTGSTGAPYTQLKTKLTDKARSDYSCCICWQMALQ